MMNKGISDERSAIMQETPQQMLCAMIRSNVDDDVVIMAFLDTEVGSEEDLMRVIDTFINFRPHIYERIKQLIVPPKEQVRTT